MGAMPQPFTSPSFRSGDDLDDVFRPSRPPSPFHRSGYDLDDVFRLDLGTKEWSRMRPVNTPMDARCAHACLSYVSRTYLTPLPHFPSSGISAGVTPTPSLATSWCSLAVSERRRRGVISSLWGEWIGFGLISHSSTSPQAASISVTLSPLWTFQL